MPESNPVAKKFGLLCEITRAQHFAWRVRRLWIEE